MIDLDLDELLSIYFYLSDKEKLPEQVDCTLLKLEKKIFSIFTVKEIEELRLSYNDKGMI